MEKNKTNLNWPPEKTVKYSLEFERDEQYMEIEVQGGQVEESRE